VMVPKADAYPAPAGHTFSNTFVVTSAPAQNNASPPRIFANHAAVMVYRNAQGTRYWSNVFDPSYGVAYSDIQEWREFTAIAWVFDGPNGTQRFVQRTLGNDDCNFGLLPT
jgi:hypothetical protein